MAAYRAVEITKTFYTIVDINGEVVKIMCRSNRQLPDGVNLEGKWLLMDRSGNYIDHDKYRSDLIDRNRIDD